LLNYRVTFSSFNIPNIRSASAAAGHVRFRPSLARASASCCSLWLACVVLVLGSQTLRADELFVQAVAGVGACSPYAEIFSGGYIESTCPTYVLTNSSGTRIAS
jgi:hypothetical protein